jgi:hypothetical protein
MAEYGAQNPPTNQQFSGPPTYGGPYPPQQHHPQQPVSGPAYPVSGPAYPVSGPQYPTSGALVPAVPEQPLCQIGEIMVTNMMVHTPVGGCPLRGSQWTAQDQWVAIQKTPTWAIVLAIVGFCILTVFSLLFLLAKETVLQGVVQVTVSNGPFTYAARVPVFNHMMAQDVHSRVNYARAIAMR